MQSVELEEPLLGLYVPDEQAVWLVEPLPLTKCPGDALMQEDWPEYGW